MARSLNLSLTDELRAFLDRNSGDGTLYATPSEFVRALIRDRKEREEASRFRSMVLQGYTDAAEGRTVPFAGDLGAMVAEVRQRDRDGWT